MCSFDPADAFTGGTSNCCGARIFHGDICSDCKEHCSDDDPTPYCAVCHAMSADACECPPDPPEEALDGSDTYRKLKDAEARSINREARMRRKP